MPTHQKKSTHTHFYHRVNLKYALVWACAHAECMHYLPKHMEEMIVGKKSICWDCRKEFILDEDALVESEPRCFMCRNPEFEGITRIKVQQV